MSFIELLIDALRSGEYTQTTEVLKRSVNGTVCHCAEGVAIEVALQYGYTEGEWIYVSSYNVFKFVHSVDGTSSMFIAPSDVDAELNNANLMLWNDRDGLTFDQIADKLEAHLEMGS